MDTNVGVFFDGKLNLLFVQAEERAVNMVLIDNDTKEPINLTGAYVGVNFPRQDGGAVKRDNFGPIVLSSEIVIQGTAVPKGYIKLPDHGLVTGDPVDLQVISGSLPAPLAALTDYLVKVIDLESFYITDLDGNVISLTSQGSGEFALVNSNDVVIDNPVLGKVILNLRAPVTQVVKADIAQSFQMNYMLGGKNRIVVIMDLLDVVGQPVS